MIPLDLFHIFVVFTHSKIFLLKNNLNLLNSFHKITFFCREARLAIRWLEREMSRGHAGLQPQEKDEKAKISLPAPGRKDAGWARYSVLECVAFFAASQDVVLLSGDPEILEHRDTQTLQVGFSLWGI